MGPNPTVGDFDAIHLRPGASGGPMVQEINGQVELEGISTAANRDGYYDGKDDLSTNYYTDLPGANWSNSTGFEPTVAVVMPLSLIKRALSSSVLQIVSSRLGSSSQSSKYIGKHRHTA
jgi:hypothetical protein